MLRDKKQGFSKFSMQSASQNCHHYLNTAITSDQTKKIRFNIRVY